ncbi:hypothetical protein [Brackiella oedipodis]|uniref:hypothetical protein n=1 Tax=Brackiella oedipodis TaxID=124225 RepID=UPI00048E36AE|nr:hypothetical protein [Brackiella oedipodis]
MTNKQANAIPNWGYEHPDVKGPNALMFFTWDLSKTIEQAFAQANEDNLEQYIEQAQHSIDMLLQRYIDLEADPESFEGQRIALHLERKKDGKGTLIALQTSPELEDRILKMQSRVKPGHS